MVTPTNHRKSVQSRILDSVIPTVSVSVEFHPIFSSIDDDPLILKILRFDFDNTLLYRVSQQKLYPSLDRHY